MSHGGTAIVVLGAAVHPGGRASPTLARRIRHAAVLAARLTSARVIGCGGEGEHGPAEAEVIRRDLIELGTTPDRILIEDQSTSTFENLLFARGIMREHGIVQALIVTDSYHMARALFTAHALDIQAKGDPVPWPKDGPAAALRRAQLREAFALPLYRARLVAWRRAEAVSSR